MIYPHFIELHSSETDRPICVNLDFCAEFYDRTFNGLDVQESYEEIKALVIEAGCSFVKKDPRVNTKPIQWEELKEMIGEPVWGENQQKWFLVAQYDEEGMEITLRGATMELYRSSVTYTEQMLIAKPLYRMKANA